MKKWNFASLVIATLVSANAFAIWGGSLVSNNQWSSVVGLQGSQSRKCSAVVVHPQVLLTAAHCLENWNKKNSVILSLSTHDQSKTVRINVMKSRYRIHSQYPENFVNMSAEDKKKNLKYDIAIIKLPDPIDQILPGVRPVDRLMGSSGGEPQLVSAGVSLTAVGLGQNSKDQKQYVKRSLPLISNGISSQSFLSAKPKLSNTSVCDGDSGGGLFATERNSEVLVGILSSTAVPCGQGLTAYYVPIQEHICWAQEKSGVALVSDPRLCR